MTHVLTIHSWERGNTNKYFLEINILLTPKAHVHDCESNSWAAEVSLLLWWEIMASNLFKGIFWYLNVNIVFLFFLALNHLKQHPFNVLIAVKCLKTFYDHLILHQTVIRNRKLRVWGSFSESAMWSVLDTMVRGWDQSKYVYNEMPDFTLGVLQDRFDKKSLEDLYKKYEQRYQLSESFFFLFDAGFTLSLFR